MNLQNKVAVITGGASGIGLASAKKLIALGAKVMIADWSNDIEKVANDLGAPEQVAFMKMDVSKDEQVKALMDETVRRFGRIDIAVANAGIGSRLMAHEETMEEWDKVIGVNLTGVYLTNKYALLQMLQQGSGSIINMTSILGLEGSPNAFAYSSTKGGIIAMTRTAAVTYAKQGIRVNAIAPGYIDTPILSGMTPEMRVMLEQMHPIGRLGEAEEIANVVAFLGSDEASFITGVTLPVDGGYVAQ